MRLSSSISSLFRLGVRAEHFTFISHAIRVPVLNGSVFSRVGDFPRSISYYYYFNYNPRENGIRFDNNVHTHARDPLRQTLRDTISNSRSPKRIETHDGKRRRITIDCRFLWIRIILFPPRFFVFKKMPTALSTSWTFEGGAGVCHRQLPYRHGMLQHRSIIIHFSKEIVFACSRSRLLRPIIHENRL